MQYSWINITGLFNFYDYHIDLNDKPEDKITLITGPNGYGKTTILAILSNLNSSNLYYFYLLKFRTIEIGLTDESVIAISQQTVEESSVRESGDIQKATIKEVRFEWRSNDDSILSFFVYNDSNIARAIKDLRYRGIQRGVLFQADDNNTLNSMLLQSKDFNEYIAHSLGQDVFMMHLEGIRTRFIHANRIYNEANTNNEELPIQRICQTLQRKLKSAYNEFLIHSQRVDGRFIEGILTKDKENITPVEYQNVASTVMAMRNELSKFRLVDNVEIPAFDESRSNVLYAYVKGLKEKYSKYGNLPQKLELLYSLLEAKKFVNKTISFSPQHGILVKSTNGDILDVKGLSSGEQNEIVMLYNLLFDVPDNSILMIDEPENSLHIVWQQVFWEDMKLISEVKNLQVIIATHSLSIVSRGAAKAVDLHYLLKG